MALAAAGGRGPGDVDADDHGRRRRGLRRDQRRPQPAPFRPGFAAAHAGRRADRPRRPHDGACSTRSSRGAAGSRLACSSTRSGTTRRRPDRRHGHGRGGGDRGPRRQADHEAALRRPSRTTAPRSSAASASSTRCCRSDGPRTATGGPRGARAGRSLAGSWRSSASAVLLAFAPWFSASAVAPAARGGVAHDRARPAAPDRRRPARVRRRGHRARAIAAPRTSIPGRGCSPSARSSPRSANLGFALVADRRRLGAAWRVADRGRRSPRSIPIALKMLAGWFRRGSRPRDRGR